MQQATFICTIALLVLSAAAQDYDYESSQPARPARLQSSGYSGNAAPKPTPVSILKQINRHNEDGSYTYGYEGGDGSFKIETKLPGGEVKGKYGYVDDTGKLRVVEYGANRYGFQPAGEGITVAPPTIVDETTNKDGTLNAEYADQGQYYEQPEAPVARPAPRPKAQPQPQFDFSSAPRFASQAPIRQASPVPPRPQIPGAQPAPVEIDYTSPPRFAAARPAPAPVHTFSPAPRPAPQRLQYAAPAPVEEDITYAEPAPRPLPRPAPIPARFAPAPQPSFRPAPQQQFAPAPRPAPRPAPIQGGRVGGVLDQLARDYALPQDAAAPLHDISFGYY